MPLDAGTAGLSVRRARFTDIPRLTELAWEAHRKSVYAADEMSAKRFKDYCMSAIMEAGKCLLVVEADGKAEGFLIGITDFLYAISKNRLATDLMTYVSEAGQGAWPMLIREFEAWARALPETMRVVEIWAGATDAIAEADRVGAGLERMKFTRFGGIYRKRIKP